VFWKGLFRMWTMFTMLRLSEPSLHTRLLARAPSCRGTRLRFTRALRSGVCITAAASEDGGGRFSRAHPPTKGTLMVI
jgi:hypothetical protein